VTVDRAFLVIGALFGFAGVALGAFGAHALRARLTPERLAQLETGVRYQLWHALGLFAVVLVRTIHPVGSSTATLSIPGSENVFGAIAGWLFVAGIVLFSGSLYALALSGNRRWGAVAPFGGTCFLLGWLALVVAALTI
jgi:uncharacterized membrane protein YgdD (TMEM256/DUF423 family)